MELLVLIGFIDTLAVYQLSISVAIDECASSTVHYEDANKNNITASWALIDHNVLH